MLRVTMLFHTLEFRRSGYATAFRKGKRACSRHIYIIDLAIALQTRVASLQQKPSPKPTRENTLQIQNDRRARELAKKSWRWNRSPSRRRLKASHQLWCPFPPRCRMKTSHQSLGPSPSRRWMKASHQPLGLPPSRRWMKASHQPLCLPPSRRWMKASH